jgi:hypothetical protein
MHVHLEDKAMLILTQDKRELLGPILLTAIVVDLDQELQEFDSEGDIVWERFETKFEDLCSNVRIGIAMIFHTSCPLFDPVRRL